MTRTQGRRPEELADVFDCLAAQTSQDFEHIVVGHKLTPEDRAVVESLIDHLPQAARARTRLILEEHGGRTRPLNTGFEAARGRYIVTLDDDDLMYEDWVMAFAELERSNAGKVLHAYAHMQTWTSGMDETGKKRRCGTSEISEEYCRDFNLLDQLGTNRCPIFTVAFPREVFHDKNLRFDETLTTYEDWDYIMRAARCCGVADIPRATGRYRIWERAENSLTAHARDEWNENRTRVLDKIAEEPLTLTPEEVKDLETRMTQRWQLEKLIGDDQIAALIEDFASDGAARLRTAKLYVDTGKDFGEDRVLEGSLETEGNRFRIEYKEIARFGKPLRLRWDPTERKNLWLQDLEIALHQKTGRIRVPVAKVRTNGKVFKDAGTGGGFGIWCFADDPQIIFPVARGTDAANAKLVITGQCRRFIPDEALR
ncbi:hypothetical protein AGMMS49983_09220 [Clostridia bacterium]|nr:hypothetical protein AGMMS49983_09220 [Clostridia bacterium]